MVTDGRRRRRQSGGRQKRRRRRQRQRTRCGPGATRTNEISWLSLSHCVCVVRTPLESSQVGPVRSAAEVPCTAIRVPEWPHSTRDETPHRHAQPDHTGNTREGRKRQVDETTWRLGVSFPCVPVPPLPGVLLGVARLSALRLFGHSPAAARCRCPPACCARLPPLSGDSLERRRWVRTRDTQAKERRKRAEQACVCLHASEFACGCVCVSSVGRLLTVGSLLHPACG